MTLVVADGVLNLHLLYRPGVLNKPSFDVLYSKVHTPSNFDKWNFPLTAVGPDSPFPKPISRFQSINIQKPLFHLIPPCCKNTSMQVSRTYHSISKREAKRDIWVFEGKRCNTEN